MEDRLTGRLGEVIYIKETEIQTVVQKEDKEEKLANIFWERLKDRGKNFLS